MHEEIKTLVRNRRHCVLATVSENQPYCSLMAYTPNGDCTRIFMVTYRNTRKFRNLVKNPHVSLLIDSRDISQAQALTVIGKFEEVHENTEKANIREFLLNDHPRLQNFVDHPDAAFICIHIKSLIFLNGLTDAYYEKLD